jgi:hypothetical protein
VIVGFLVGGLSEYNFGNSEVVMIAWAPDGAAVGSGREGAEESSLSRI